MVWRGGAARHGASRQVARPVWWCVCVIYICQLGIELVEQRGPDNNKHSKLTQQWPTGGAMVGALRERRHPRGASMPPGATELPMRAKCCRATAFVGVPIDLPVQYPWMPGQAGQGREGESRS